MSRTLGHELLEEFGFRDDWTNMNHGSFGAVPEKVRQCLHKKQQLVDSSPDLFVRFQYGPLLHQSRQKIANFVHAPVSSVVLIPNATIGLDTVLRNVKYSSCDHILIFDTVYGTVERTILELSESTGVQVSRITIRYPLSHTEILEAFYNKVADIQRIGHVVKIAIFDVISFQPGVRMPFESLISACRTLGILSCVDGAHSLGHIPIDLTTLDPDFFVGNLHKWLFTPRGCAILYVPPHRQPLIRTSFPTSWGFLPKSHISSGTFKQNPNAQSSFEQLFESFGTMDYSPFLCIGAALDFREARCGGEKEILTYNTRLAQKGGWCIARILNTDVLDNAEGSLTRGCCMVNVRLPLEDALTKTNSAEIVDLVSKTLIERYKTYVPVFTHAGLLWARVSAQIYLEMDDFVRLGNALKEICTTLQRNFSEARAAIKNSELPGSASFLHSLKNLRRWKPAEDWGGMLVLGDLSRQQLE